MGESVVSRYRKASKDSEPPEQPNQLNQQNYYPQRPYPSYMYNNMNMGIPSANPANPANPSNPAHPGNAINQPQNHPVNHNPHQTPQGAQGMNIPNEMLNPNLNMMNTLNPSSINNYYDVRPRGDSIYLPPPVVKYRDDLQQQQQPIQQHLQQSLQQQVPAGSGASRSNSIFNSLVNIPGGSVSGPSTGLISIQDFENYINLLNNLPPGSSPGNKESLSNILAFNTFMPSRSNLQDRKNSKSSKNSSIDLSNPLIWENYPSNMQTGASFANILQGIQNGSIDFTNMSNEQRRDSILKIMNDMNKPTSLKEDIFNKDRETLKLDKPLSPTSSSKSDAKYEVPQSPKTSPSYSTTSYQPSDTLNQSQYNYRNPYIYTNVKPEFKLNKQDIKDLPTLPEKDDTPKLGATKIDQLMLVLQSKDHSNQDIKIKRDESGRIVGEIKPQHLIGGVEKNKLVPRDDSEDSKSKKRKLPQCPYCSKFFSQTTQLEVHIRSHIGLKPFECNYCHKRFTQGGNLTTHLRLHTGEKPFVCDICSRSFSRKGNLAAHKLTHENLKPYDCKLDGCDKSFTQLGNLKSHQNKFHLDTLNGLTLKLTELSNEELENLPTEEKELLSYFKSLYKNSNKGIKGRGKRN